MIKFWDVYQAWNFYKHLWWTSIRTHPLGLSWKMISFFWPPKLTFTFVQVKAWGYGWLLSHLFFHYVLCSIFTSTLCFCLNLIQPSTFSIFTCECGHGLNTFGTHLTWYPFGGHQIATHDAIKNIMYAYAQESGHIVWREWWYTLASISSLWTNLCMICKD
jgi:hypothetical protein